MDELLKQKLAENGVDIKSTVSRFMGNEGMWLKFLLKLKNDQNFVYLKDNLLEENYEEAFKNAHTIKGMCANLGLDPVAKEASAMTELLRGKEAVEVDREAVKSTQEALEKAYNLFLELIDQYA